MKKKCFLFLLLPFCFLIGNMAFNSSNYEPAITFASSSAEADEFISYWRNDVRAVYPDICQMGKEKYNEVFSKYIALSSSAKSVVDSTIDVEPYTIKDSMTTLINKYSSQQKQSQVFTLNKDTTLTIIIVVGVLGMTSIAGFYYMKTKNVIE